MMNSTRKTTRNTAPSQTKPLGSLRQHQDSSRRKSLTLTVDGESKLLIGNVVTSPERPSTTTTTTSKRNPVTGDTSTLFNDKPSRDHKESQYDHSPCHKLILELREEIRNVKKENKNLEIEVKVTCSDLSLKKQEKEIVESENMTLKDTIQSLETSNCELNKSYMNLEEKVKKKKEIWKNEKDILEKTLNEIRKELEAKIIEIRAKHREEVLNLEEKNRILKVYLSDNLKVNSWERQQEIQRISQDLEKSIENERNMKNHLNKLMSSNDNLRYCSKCQSEIIGIDQNKSKKLTREKELNNFKKLSVDFKELSKPNLGGHKSAEGNYY